MSRRADIVPKATGRTLSFLFPTVKDWPGSGGFFCQGPPQPGWPEKTRVLYL